MFVQFVGRDHPFDTIIVTQGSDNFRGQPSEFVRGEKEKAVSEWLEAKGDLQHPPYLAFLPYPQASTRMSTGGLSSSMSDRKSVV